MENNINTNTNENTNTNINETNNNNLNKKLNKKANKKANKKNLIIIIAIVTTLTLAVVIATVATVLSVTSMNNKSDKNNANNNAETQNNGVAKSEESKAPKNAKVVINKENTEKIKNITLHLANKLGIGLISKEEINVSEERNSNNPETYYKSVVASSSVNFTLMLDKDFNLKKYERTFTENNIPDRITREEATKKAEDIMKVLNLSKDYVLVDIMTNIDTYWKAVYSLKVDDINNPFNTVTLKISDRTMLDELTANDEGAESFYKPQISKQKAIDIINSKFEGVNSVNKAYIMMQTPNNFFSETNSSEISQKVENVLSWIITVSNTNNFKTTNFKVYIDSNSGEIIGGTNLN